MSILESVVQRNLENTKKCIENGEDVNTINGLGMSLLMLATHQGYLEIVKILVENGVNISYEHEKYSGHTAYSEAESQYIVYGSLKHKEILEYLKSKGAIR